MAESQITGFDINAFATKLGNVAALNQFYASVTLPSTLQATFTETDRFVRKIGFSMTAVNVPTFTVAEIPVNFRSAKFRIPGDRDMTQTWNVTVRSDVDTVTRSVFERWSDAIVGQVEHDTLDDENVLNLMGVGELHQLSRNSKILKSWYLSNAWPSEVGEIAYDFSSENAIVTFPVTFVFQAIESNTTRNNVISERDALSGSVLF